MNRQDTRADSLEKPHPDASRPDASYPDSVAKPRESFPRASLPRRVSAEPRDVLPRHPLEADVVLSLAPHFESLRPFEKFTGRGGHGSASSKEPGRSQEVYRETKRLGLRYGREFLDFFRKAENLLPGLLTPDDKAVFMLARSWFSLIGHNFRVHTVNVQLENAVLPKALLTFQCVQGPKHSLIIVCPHWTVEDLPPHQGIRRCRHEHGPDPGSVSCQLQKFAEREALRGPQSLRPSDTVVFLACSPEDFLKQVEATEFSDALTSETPILSSKQVMGVLAGIARSMCRRERRREMDRRVRELRGASWEL